MIAKLECLLFVGVVSSLSSTSAFDVASIDKLVTFAPGQNTALLSVDIVIDDDIEDDEAFVLELIVDNDGSLGRFPTLTVTIIDTSEPLEGRKGEVQK